MAFLYVHAILFARLRSRYISCFFCFLLICLVLTLSTKQEQDTMSDHSYHHLRSLSVDLNNKGSALLTEKRFKAASSCFQSALHVCRSIMKSEYMQEDCADTSGGSLDDYMGVSSTIGGGCSRKVSSLFLNDDDDDDDESSSSSNKELLVSSSYYVHSEPIVIPSPMSESLNVGTILPAIIIFNQALAHHCLGMTNDRYLKKAVRLYQCCLNLVIDQEVFDESKCFTLACLNNMGLSYKHLKNTSAAQMCYQQLMSTLMLSLHSNHQESSSPSLKVYFRSVTHLVFQQTSPAAAA